MIAGFFKGLIVSLGRLFKTERAKNKQINTRYITELGLFIGVILLMKLTGLSSIPVGPLVMTFTMIPIAVGAMLLGPLAGTILGLFYGLLSLYDAITGKSLMTGLFFQYSPFLTVLLCVGTRTLVGYLTGLLFHLFQKLDRRRIWSYFAGGLLAPMLNTFFFMGFIVLAFYRTDYIQSRVFALTKGVPAPLVIEDPLHGVYEAIRQWIPALKESIRIHNASLGSKGPLLFVLLTVGFQGLIEWATGLLIGGSVAKGVAVALKRYEPIPFFKPARPKTEAVEGPKAETELPEEPKETELPEESKQKEE